jgi:hypothetical protein
VAVLYVSEHKSAMSSIGTANAPVLPAPPLAVQALAIGGASVPSTAFGTNTQAVLLVSDLACHFKFGPATGGVPVAAATDNYLPANVPLVFAVVPGQQIAVIS